MKMIYEHEIPKGSRLYFGKSAKLKRKIENIASEILEKYKFDEIVTPHLSYHQHNFINQEQLLRFSDCENNELVLRGDSTLDVVRIVTKRLGRTTEQKKWFYIQPVFRYPSSEMYQIGGEIIQENDIKLALKITSEIFSSLNINPLLQISHIQIPKILSSMLGLGLNVFENGNLETLLAQNEPWLSALATLQYPDQINKVLQIVPSELKEPLLQMQDLAQFHGNSRVIIAPLYYAKMRYYDNLFFRFIHKNDTFGMGGCYKLDDIHSSGFGIYTDRLIKHIIQEEK